MSLFDEGLSEFRAVVDGFQVKAEADLAVLTRDLAAAVAAGGDKDAEIATLNGKIAELRARIVELEKAPPVEEPEEPEEPDVPDVPDVPSPSGEFYGPTGVWPFDWTATAQVVDVACSWAAIGDALRTGLNVPLVVRVAPGVLTGGNAGSTSTPVIQGIHRTAPALVVPRDGFGTVTTSASWRLHNLRHINFARFDLWPFGFVITDCEDVTFAQSTTKPANITTTGKTARVTFHELVRLEPVNEDADAWAIRNAATTSITEDITIRGCVVLGTYKAAVSSAHTDTIQGSGAGAFRRLLFEDSIIVTSSNHGLIFSSDGTQGVVFRRTAVIGGGDRLNRFPDAADRYKGSGGIAINSKPQGLEAHDSIITGSIVPQFDVVNGSRATDVEPAPKSGGWTQIPTGSLTPEWWAAHAPIPTRTQLKALWR